MAAEATEGGIEELSPRIQSYPRDLLRRFSGVSCREEVPDEAGAGSGEMELSLGLSLGGLFGADPGEKRLVRSSTIDTLSMSMFPLEHDPTPAVGRTYSLPTETEEEHRKRKELQSLKRQEAKRKRTEKRCSRSGGTKDRKEESLYDDTNGGHGTVATKAEVISSLSGFLSAARVGGQTNGVVPPELPAWALRPADASRSFQSISQGSVGSQGSSSSSLSDFESRPSQGFNISGLSSCSEARSSPTIPSSLNNTNDKAATPPSPVVGKPTKVSGEEDDQPKKKKTAGRVNGTKADERNMMEEMPCVSTQGDGPNGRRIEGFLYRYKKGEEVRIVCVCHGSFLTPAEFVKHAGGGDVAYPLRHIVVNPSPSAFL